MIPGARLPCVNRMCCRTAAQERHPDSREIICGKCFKALPDRLRRRFRNWWKRHRKLDRMERRKAFQERPRQWGLIREIENNLGRMIWRDIRRQFQPQARPRGIDAFLDEIGLTNG